MIIGKIKQLLSRINKFAELEISERTTFAELENLARKESANYIYNHAVKAVLFKDSFEYWTHLISKIPKSGLLLEFGVLQGTSINFMAQKLIEQKDKRTFYGFDSFEGLSENWGGTALKKGAMSSKGKLPEVQPNVKLIKGWVNDTFVPFMRQTGENDNKIAYMHLDMDVYGPTKFVLENSIQYLMPGTIIDFDDLVGFPGWKEGEYKAMKETLDNKVKYEHMAFCEPEYMPKPYKGITKAAIQITDV